MEKEIKINVPEGYEIDKEKSTFEKIVFKKSDGLPMRWEELGKIEGYYIGGTSSVYPYEKDYPLQGNRNTWPTEEEAEAALALSQLLQLRNAWNGEWRKDWTDESYVAWSIEFLRGEAIVAPHDTMSYPLYFVSQDAARKFLDTFRDLIETAKPLL